MNVYEIKSVSVWNDIGNKYVRYRQVSAEKINDNGLVELKRNTGLALIAKVIDHIGSSSSGRGNENSDQ